MRGRDTSPFSNSRRQSHRIERPLSRRFAPPSPARGEGRLLRHFGEMRGFYSAATLAGGRAASAANSPSSSPTSALGVVSSVSP